MSLYLSEIALDPPRATEDVLTAIDAAVRNGGGAEVLEFQVTADRSRIYVIAEASEVGTVSAAVREAVPDGAVLHGPDPVRLVGAELDAVKRARSGAGYLVEWDLPAELGMDEYLARKREKAPRYQDVPEVTFLRTYVREDMEKCVCLYDSPDEELVRKAREAVDSPVDRLYALGQPGDHQ